MLHSNVSCELPMGGQSSVLEMFSRRRDTIYQVPDSATSLEAGLHYRTVGTNYVGIVVPTEKNPDPCKIHLRILVWKFTPIKL